MIGKSRKPKNIKFHNQRLVLSLMRQNDVISASEIAQRINLSITTVVKILAVLQENGSLRLPPQAVEEYRITEEGQVILFTGSKSTGGFCVTRRGLLLPSKLGRILTDCSGLGDGSLPPARLLAYKGRSYCWLPISPEGELSLPQGLMEQLQLTPGLALLAIRSSDIAFTMGARGPLLERARAYPGEIPAF